MDQEQEWAGDFDPFSDPEERRVLYATIDSFKQYRRTAHLTTTHRRRQNFYALPRAHWELLAEAPFNLQDTFNRVDDAIDANADIAEAILATGLEAFGLPPEPDKGSEFDWQGKATPSDLHKAHQTVRQFYRDWSAEGAVERQACYDPVLADLEELFPLAEGGSRAAVEVLVPGAGLGRLVFEICRAGFAAEGNEISYHQLLASSWVLNHTARPEEHVLYPFVREFSNLETRSHQLQQVLVPDVHPGMAMAPFSGTAECQQPPGTMSMSAADFVTLYGGPRNRGRYDAVVTVFFVDTAPNVIRYVETICNCLKPGGVWINLGPLLWHFDERVVKNKKNVDESEDDVDDGFGAPPPAAMKEPDRDLGIGEPGSIELTNEEVLLLVQKMGFQVERSQMRSQECGYIQGPRTMLQHMYKVSHWVARKALT